MAEGFLQSKGNNNIDMETTGRNNVSILLRNSLLQCVNSDDYGNVTHYNMHDLVHDLACSILCENNEGVCKSRYIGYKPSGDGLLSIPKGEERYVRTLFFDGKVSDIKFSDFESLHTLTLVGEDTDNLPNSIRELKHLRYLDISKTRIRYLPDSSGELYHLQTLRADNYFLKKLPDSLRHLHISSRITLLPEIGKLTSLQTLPYFHVGSKKGCEISELGKLKDLKGKLEICNLEKVRDKNEATSADLILKSGIYKLNLVWGRSREGDEANDESVLEGLQPHPNLKSLSISGFNGKSLLQLTSRMAVQLDGHSWEGLNNLMEINLKGCCELEELPMLGQLRNLKYLYLSGLTNVKSIRPSFYGLDNCTINGVVFPALKRLELDDMTNLKEWDEAGDLASEVVVFPRLQYLKIQGCDQLMRAPSHFPCLEELEINGMNSGLALENICGMKLTSLTHLKIWSIKELECLPDGLFSYNRNLKKLVIYDCPKMTHLVPLILRGRGGAPSLRELGIYNCSSLRELPDDLHRINSLENLFLWKCRDLKSIPYPRSRGGHESQQQQQQQQGFTSLRQLRIEDCFGLTNLPIEMLESCALTLEILTLQGLSSLTNISEVIGCLHKMTRLTYLNIRGVPKFSICSDIIQMVSSLKRLGMGHWDSSSDSSWNEVSFNETVDAMLPQFTSLRSLTLGGMEQWECLPDGIQHLTSLEFLSLWNFGIEALPEWVGNLSYLERLRLWDCKKLRHFPSKQAMQRLSKLTDLWIYACPLLFKEENRSNDNNKRIIIIDSEWPNISHIPTIYVNRKKYSHLTATK